MRAKNLSSVPFVTTIVHKKQTWLPSLHQFIKIEFPPSIWLRTFHQFMGRRNCTSVPFVITSFHIKVLWLGTLHQFMRPKKHSNVYLWLQICTKGRFDSTSVHEGKKPFKCSICNYNCSQKANLTPLIASIHKDRIFT